MQLRQELHEHNYRYYVENAPVISDQDFDMMMRELQELEARHPEMHDDNSPSQRVGSDISSEFKQVLTAIPCSRFRIPTTARRWLNGMRA